MLSQTLILQGGEDINKRENEALILKICELSKKKKILVIPWTADSVESEEKHKKPMEKYFSDCGFSEVLFLERENNQAEEHFAKVDVIYLPGGNPEILYHEIDKRDLNSMLKNFAGTIIGNSAGAIVLSKGQCDDRRFAKGFGLVDFYVEVHFKLNQSKPCEKEVDNPKLIIGIPERAWISVTRSISR